MKRKNNRVSFATISILIIISFTLSIFYGCTNEVHGNLAEDYDAADEHHIDIDNIAIDAVIDNIQAMAVVDTPMAFIDENNRNYSSDYDNYEVYDDNAEEYVIIDDIDNNVVIQLQLSQARLSRPNRLWNRNASTPIIEITEEEEYIYTEPYSDYEETEDIAAELPPRSPRDPNEKLIALTFDDGPSRHTQRLLDILAEHNSVATFFVLGDRVWDHRQILQNMIAQGSEAAGHAWHHVDLTRVAERQYIKDQITYTDNAIAAVTGERPPPFFRPPYGHFNDTVRDVARELGVALIHWNINPNDWRYRNADTIYSYIMRNAQNGGIVLLHDIHVTTVDAMERVIPSLIAQGFRLVTVSYLLRETVPGNIYFSEFSSR